MKSYIKKLAVAVFSIAVILLFTASFSSGNNVTKTDINRLIADSLYGAAVSKSDLIGAPTVQSTLIYKPFALKSADRKALNALAKKHKAMGVSVAIIQDGTVTNHYEYGWANKEEKIKMTADHKIRIASISKPAIAMAFMSLCDSSEITPDTTMGEIFGDNENYKNLTIRSLMSHAAGLSEAGVPNGNGPRTLSNRISMEKIYKYKPYSRWKYSNLGFDIVGAAVEKSSGQFFQDYTAEKFFRPMNLDASWDGSYIENKDLMANSYSSDHKVTLSKEGMSEPHEKNELGENYTYMAGGLISSSVDLARLFSIMINDGKYMDKQYLSKESVDAIHTVQDIKTYTEFSQCLGFRYAENFCNGHDMYFHPGNAYGVLSLVAYDPNDKSGVAIITTGAKMARDKFMNFTVCSDMLEYIYENIIDKKQ